MAYRRQCSILFFKMIKNGKMLEMLKETCSDFFGIDALFILVEKNAKFFTPNLD